MSMAVVLAGSAGYRSLERRLLDPWYFSSESDTQNRYQLTLMMNPVGFMLTNRYFTTDPEGDLAAISAIIDPAVYRATYTPFEIEYYWNSVPGRVDDAEIAGFKRVFISAALNNPMMMLSNRVLVFGASLGSDPRTRYPFHLDRESRDDASLYTDSFRNLLSEHGLHVRKESPHVISRVTNSLRDWSYPRMGWKSPGFWIWSAAPSLMVAVASVVLIRRARISGALALVILAPLVLMFLATPAAHFKYMTALYAFGLLAWPLLIHELLSSRRARIRASG
jgi:hypothetical protein